MLDNISIRIAQNGFIVAWSWYEGEGEKREWMNEEKVFLEKSEMRDFITELVDKLT